MSPRIYLASALSIACVALTSAETRADSLSCKGRIIASGDSTYKAQAICGKPDAASTRVEVRRVSDRVSVPCQDGRQRCTRTVERSVEVIVDEWVYDFGRHRFMQHLTFEQGKLVSIEAGTYGEK
jgi:hypothetical protein